MGSAGWYGKLPAIGDFIQRRLPPEFVTPWDAWLQHGITHCQAALGSAWLDTYLTAHVWHFVLMPGLIGRSGWAGVWMPSVDRVGRYFPFTLAAPLAAEQPLGNSTAALGDWLKALEENARLALQPDQALEHLDARLAELGPPPNSASPVPPLTGVSARLAQRETLIDLPSLSCDCLDALASASLRTAVNGYSLWWCHGNDGRCGGFAQRGLPDAAFMLKMLFYSPGG